MRTRLDRGGMQGPATVIWLFPRAYSRADAGGPGRALAGIRAVICTIAAGLWNFRRAFEFRRGLSVLKETTSCAISYSSQ